MQSAIGEAGNVTARSSSRGHDSYNTSHPLSDHSNGRLSSHWSEPSRCFPPTECLGDASVENSVPKHSITSIPFFKPSSVEYAESLQNDNQFTFHDEKDMNDYDANRSSSLPHQSNSLQSYYLGQPICNDQTYVVIPKVSSTQDNIAPNSEIEISTKEHQDRYKLEKFLDAESRMQKCPVISTVSTMVITSDNPGRLSGCDQSSVMHDCKITGSEVTDHQNASMADPNNDEADHTSNFITAKYDEKLPMPAAKQGMIIDY